MVDTVATSRATGQAPGPAAGPGTRRATGRATDARRRLLTAAIEELAGQGELEVAAVARRAGVSVGLPYRYFGTRSGLISAVLADFHERLDDAVMLRPFPGERWVERERARVVAWVDFLYDDPLTPVALGRGTGDGEVAARALAHLHRTIEVGARNMAAGQRAGDLPADRDPGLVAAAVLGGVHTAVITALTGPSRPDRQVLIDELWTFITSAVGLPADHDRGGRR